MLEKEIVVFRKAFQQAFAPRRGVFQLRAFKRRTRPCAALIRFVEAQAVHADEINDAAKTFRRAHRDDQRQGIRPKALLHGPQDGLEISAHPVHFVHEGQLGHAEVFRLSPDRFRLRLHPAHGAEDAHCAVEHAQGAFHFNGEVHMAGRINNVDGRAVPFAGRAGGSDGDAAFLLLRQVIHGGRAVVDFAHTMDFAGIKQHPFRKRGLARVDMGDHADVAHSLRHGNSL